MLQSVSLIVSLVEVDSLREQISRLHRHRDPLFQRTYLQSTRPDQFSVNSVFPRHCRGRIGGKELLREISARGNDVVLEKPS